MLKKDFIITNFQCFELLRTNNIIVNLTQNFSNFKNFEAIRRVIIISNHN